MRRIVLATLGGRKFKGQIGQERSSRVCRPYGGWFGLPQINPRVALYLGSAHGDDLEGHPPLVGEDKLLACRVRFRLDP